jgi:shikimate kinase
MASLLKYSFVDLDKYIQEKENKTIQFIFDNEGEDEFRRLETKYLAELISQNEKHVIALGGGTVCFNNNVDLVKANGILVYIRMSPQALAERLLKSRQKRPLLKNISAEKLPSFIESKLNERNRYYNQAHIVADGINFNYLQLHQALLENKM